MTREHTSSDGYRYVAERIVRLAGAGGIGSRPVEYWRVKVYTTAGEVTKTLLLEIGNVLNFDTVLGITQALQIGTSLAYGLSGQPLPATRRNPAAPSTVADIKVEIPSTLLDARTTDYLELIIHGTTKR
jgi:hypothetical protein